MARSDRAPTRARRACPDVATPRHAPPRTDRPQPRPPPARAPPARGRAEGSRSGPGRASTRRQDDVTVVVQPETGIVGDLPGVPVEIAEHTGVPAVERLGRLPRDLGTVRAGQLDHLVHLVAGADIVSEADTAKPRAIVGHAQVGTELLASPERQDHPTRLEESGLLDVQRRHPAES